MSTSVLFADTVLTADTVLYTNFYGILFPPTSFGYWANFTTNSRVVQTLDPCYICTLADPLAGQDGLAGSPATPPKLATREVCNDEANAIILTKYTTTESSTLYNMVNLIPHQTEPNTQYPLSQYGLPDHLSLPPYLSYTHNILPICLESLGGLYPVSISI